MAMFGEKMKKNLLIFLSGALTGIASFLSVWVVVKAYNVIFAEYSIASKEQIDRIRKKLPQNAYNVKSVSWSVGPDSASWTSFSAPPKSTQTFVTKYLKKRTHDVMDRIPARTANGVNIDEEIGWYSQYSQNIETYKGELFRLIYDTSISRVYTHEFDM